MESGIPERYSQEGRVVFLPFRALLVYRTRGDICVPPGSQIDEENLRRSAREKRSFSIVAATHFVRSTCLPCSQGIWSVAAALFPLLAIRILSPPSFSCPRFAKSRGRRLWLRVWERRKSKAKASDTCPGKTSFIGFLQGRNPSQVF